MEDTTTEDVLEPSSVVGEEVDDDHDNHDDHDEDHIVLRWSTRVHYATKFYGQLVNAVTLTEHDEPANYKEAMESTESEKWLETIRSEIDSMYANKVCTWVDIPEDRKAVENKWIFKKKTNTDGNISIYKARLVAKCFRQVQGVDYKETFSPVAMLKSIRILLAIASYYDYEIW